MFEALCNHLKYSTNKGNLRWGGRFWVFPAFFLHNHRCNKLIAEELFFYRTFSGLFLISLLSRSAITIFPQRSDGKHDFRIWNPQVCKCLPPARPENGSKSHLFVFTAHILCGLSKPRWIIRWRSDECGNHWCRIDAINIPHHKFNYSPFSSIPKVCLKLGWKPTRTDFDILPLVLSANGHEWVFGIPCHPR